MSGTTDGLVRIATGMCIALVVWGGVLVLGYWLGSLLGRRGLSLPRRFAVGALAVVIGVALLAPNPARADDAYDRAMDAAEAWDYAEAASWLHVAAERGDVRAQERLGLMLVHGERLYGAALRSDAAEGLEWLERAAGRGSDVPRFVLTRVYGAPDTLAASR
ncbi:MAG: hypothetical protein MUC55_03975 [Burkholderiales bacterium]|nr:hypothetical protein [Burkholderiales bacterium]